MKTLALAAGDLVVGPTGHATISGSRKIRQELALHLGETYGADKYHPEMGSVLVEYIGEVIDDTTQMLVQAEVARVVQQYIGIQQREVLRDHLAARASRFDSSDVVTGIADISATVNFDTIRVSVTLTTAANETIQVNRTIQP